MNRTERNTSATINTGDRIYIDTATIAMKARDRTYLYTICKLAVCAVFRYDVWHGDTLFELYFSVHAIFKPDQSLAAFATSTKLSLNVGARPRLAVRLELIEFTALLDWESATQ